MDGRILLVDDEKDIVDLLENVLTEEGFSLIQKAYTGTEAIRLCREYNPDIVILDIMLPDLDGLEVCRKIREFSYCSILFLSSRNDDIDKILGLACGGDDYITKPFALAELIARVECVLRRYHKGQEKLLFRDLEIDAVSRVVRRNGENIDLTMKELDLLLLFLRNRNITLFRDRIYEEVWEGEYDGESRTVDLHVQRLKKKLGLHTSIISVRKIGYRLED